MKEFVEAIFLTEHPSIGVYGGELRVSDLALDGPYLNRTFSEKLLTGKISFKSRPSKAETNGPNCVPPSISYSRLLRA